MRAYTNEHTRMYTQCACSSLITHAQSVKTYSLINASYRDFNYLAAATCPAHVVEMTRVSRGSAIIPHSTISIGDSLAARACNPGNRRKCDCAIIAHRERSNRV